MSKTQPALKYNPLSPNQVSNKVTSSKIYQEKKKNAGTIMWLLDFLMRQLCDEPDSPASPTDWIVDSGATSHITGFKRYYTPSTFQPCFQVGWQVVGHLRIRGYGNVQLSATRLNDQAPANIELKNVGYVPGAQNLISVLALCDQYSGDLSLQCEGEYCVFMRKSDASVMAWGLRERRRGLCVLQKGREPPVKVDNEKAQELGKK